MYIHHKQETYIPLADAVFCDEEQWDHDEDETLEIDSGDLNFENDELLSLLSKESVTHLELNSELSNERRLAVDWVIGVSSCYGFKNLTAILAINYLDRYVLSLEWKRETPWLMQLAAVTCLSLAAKVEETQVPLLLDFQVEGAKYVFEAKTIQKMELLVLSTLKWKMNPVTPLSFVDYIITKPGFKTPIHWEFSRRCETILLVVLSDSRFVEYLPSVLAATTMLRAIQQLEPFNHVDYQNQLLRALNLTWATYIVAFIAATYIVALASKEARWPMNITHGPCSLSSSAYQ